MFVFGLHLKTHQNVFNSDYWWAVWSAGWWWGGGVGHVFLVHFLLKVSKILVSVSVLQPDPPFHPVDYFCVSTVFGLPVYLNRPPPLCFLRQIVSVSEPFFDCLLNLTGLIFVVGFLAAPCLSGCLILKPVLRWPPASCWINGFDLLAFVPQIPSLVSTWAHTHQPSHFSSSTLLFNLSSGVLCLIHPKSLKPSGLWVGGAAFCTHKPPPVL